MKSEQTKQFKFILIPFRFSLHRWNKEKKKDLRKKLRDGAHVRVPSTLWNSFPAFPQTHIHVFFLFVKNGGFEMVDTMSVRILIH